MPTSSTAGPAGAKPCDSVVELQDWLQGRNQRRTSGDMYSTVPTGLMAASCFMLIVSPKSPSFSSPPLPMKMFSSFTSRWMTASACILCTPQHRSVST